MCQKTLRADSQRATLLPRPTNDALSSSNAESLVVEKIQARSPSSLVLSALRSETWRPKRRMRNQKALTTASTSTRYLQERLLEPPELWQRLSEMKHPRAALFSRANL